MDINPREFQFNHQYVYFSKRLLREVYDRVRAQDNLPRPEALQIGVPGMGSVNIKASEDQVDNIYWLTAFANRALASRTKPLSHVQDGQYLRAVLPLTYGLLPVIGAKRPVAWMYARYVDRLAGRSLVTLCGSGSNYRGAAPSQDFDPEYFINGWYPSSGEGLRALISAMSEGREDEARFDLSKDRPTASDLSGYFDYMDRWTALSSCHLLAAGYFEVLAEVFYRAPQEVASQLNSHQEPYYKYDTIVLGAPLWVRTAIPPRTTEPSSDFSASRDKYDDEREAQGHNDKRANVMKRFQDWLRARYLG